MGAVGVWLAAEGFGGGSEDFGQGLRGLVGDWGLWLVIEGFGGSVRNKWLLFSPLLMTQPCFC